MLLLLTMACMPCLLERTDRSCEDWPPGGQDTDTADTGEGGEDTGPSVISTDEGDGVTETWVDATAYLDFVYLSLATGLEVEVADPLSSTDWDLGFERYLIASNGGVSGPGEMEAVVVTDTSFEDLTTAPTDGYTSDLPDDDDENQNPEYALGDWFEYGEENHTLTPLNQVYVVKAVSGSYYKLQILDYYDDAGTPAYITFRWAAVAGPTE